MLGFALRWGNWKAAWGPSICDETVKRNRQTCKPAFHTFNIEGIDLQLIVTLRLKQKTHLPSLVIIRKIGEVLVAPKLCPSTTAIMTSFYCCRKSTQSQPFPTYQEQFALIQQVIEKMTVGRQNKNKWIIWVLITCALTLYRLSALCKIVQQHCNIVHFAHFSFFAKYWAKLSTWLEAIHSFFLSITNLNPFCGFFFPDTIL